MKRSHDNRLSFGFIFAGDEDSRDVQKILDRIVPPSGLLRGVRRTTGRLKMGTVR